jgi:hypothetical protein
MLAESWIPVPPEEEGAAAAVPSSAFDPASIEYTVWICLQLRAI